MLRMTSKLLCAMVWGATVWGVVVTLLACSRMNIDFQFSRDMSADCHLVVDRNVDSGTEGHAGSLERTPREFQFDELPEYAREYAWQVFYGVWSKGSDPLERMCTMVMLTYNRENVLKFLLNHYCKVKSLHKIIVIWNNVNKKIPDDILDVGEQKCLPKLLFIQEEENKLTNRFKPRTVIETKCKFNVCDITTACQELGVR